MMNFGAGPTKLEKTQEAEGSFRDTIEKLSKLSEEEAVGSYGDTVSALSRFFEESSDVQQSFSLDEVTVVLLKTRLERLINLGKELKPFVEEYREANYVKKPFLGLGLKSTNGKIFERLKEKLELFNVDINKDNGFLISPTMKQAYLVWLEQNP